MGRKAAYLVAVFLTIGAIAFFAVSRRADPSADTGSGAGSGRTRVVTTLFPLYDMARAIGGDDADVTLLLPPGMSPHSFEPKPSDIADIGTADIFVYTGDFMEPWARDTIAGLGRTDLRVVDASEGVSLLPMSAHDEEGEEHDKESHGHDGGNDPHIWLDFDNASLMTAGIADAFAQADPAHAAAYADRASDYMLGLSETDLAYREGLSDCRTRTIVYGGHYAFGYPAHRYGLEYVAAQGFSPDAEPTADDLVTLVEQVRSLGLPYVFSETLSNPKIAEMIANETGASVLELNPAGNISRDAFERGMTFSDIMESNLSRLKTGLGCGE